MVHKLHLANPHFSEGVLGSLFKIFGHAFESLTVWRQRLTALVEINDLKSRAERHAAASPSFAAELAWAAAEAEGKLYSQVVSKRESLYS